MKFNKNIIQPDKKKGILGAVLAAFVLVLFVFKLEWYMGVAFGALFLAVGFLKLDLQNKVVRTLLGVLWGAAVLSAVWGLSVVAVTTPDQMRVSWSEGALNLLCMLLPFLAVLLFSANWRASFASGVLVLAVLSTVNGFVFQFRGKEVMPMDILSIRTALNVAGQYFPVVTKELVYAWTVLAILLFAGFSLTKSPKRSGVAVRLFALGAIVLSLTVLWFVTEEIPIKTWEDEGTRINGYYLNFYLGVRDAVPKKPEGYKKDVVESASLAYSKEVVLTPQEDLPNIIVIMDESYADFRIFGEELRTNQPVTPFLDSLTENTIRGHALASVFGGNTANSEFEFLTGHSMAFLPRDSLPYQQYIEKNIYSLAWLLKSYGYKTVATHPYFASGWSRQKIYPLMGFEESTFLDSYPQEDLLRYYVSDREMLEVVLNEYLLDETRQEPLFLFGVTMQNHGGFTHEDENYEKTIELLGYSREFPQAEQYLTLIHETDKAMEAFLTALSEVQEDTVVLFFGDHFPKLDDEFYEEVYGSSFDTLPEIMLQYTVPFYIWANYDLPEEEVALTGLNYLSRYLLEAAGLPSLPYYRFLKDAERSLPAMNALGYYSYEQEGYIPYSEAKGEEQSLLREYEFIQYNNLFDLKNRNQVFFEKYMKPAGEGE